MAVPAVIAFKERDDIAKLVVYAIAAIAIIYALYKLFGAFKSLGEKIENAIEGVKEGLSELGQYGLTRPVTPHDTAEIIRKRASKNPDEPYLVPSSIYNALKEQGENFPSNVRPYTPDYSKVERKTSAVGSRLGLWTPKPTQKTSAEENSVKTAVIGGIVPGYGFYKSLKNLLSKDEKQSGVKPRNISIEEYKDLQAKRWEAIARYYEKQKIPEKWGARPIKEPPHILPIRHQFEIL